MPAGPAPTQEVPAANSEPLPVLPAPARMEFALAPEDLPALLRMPGLSRSGRAARVELAWRDTPDGALASRNLALCVEAGPNGAWRLEALHRAAGLAWPAATPAPVGQQGSGPAAFEPSLPDGLATVAAFRGRRHRLLDEDGVSVTVLEGHLRAADTLRPACRLALEGPSLAVAARAGGIAAALRLHVPRAGLAAEAAAMNGTAGAAWREPVLPPLHRGQALTDAVAQVVGGLLDALLHWSATAGGGGSPVPVHQMRVATRRLRSALSMFRHAAACPALAPLGAALRDTAAQLGAARDWDVFLGGTGAEVALLFPDEPRVAALMASARRRRAAAYAALRSHLGGPAFRGLAASLACAAALRPWEGQDAAQDAVLQDGTEEFAAAMLARRLRQVRRAGRGMRHLPVPALHELRKDCKRLRYAAEIFLPLYPDKPGRRFIRHLSALQDVLGSLNDGASAAGLLAQLGRAGEGYAAGLVNGYAAAGIGAFRAEIGDAWRGFRRAEPFWT